MGISNSEPRIETLDTDIAKLHARNIFPSDTRAQDLLARSIAGSFVLEEQNELNELFARNQQEKRYSSGVIDLFDRHEGGDPNVVFVDMNSIGGDITVLPNGQGKDIFTAGLGGCYSSLLYFEQPDGMRNATLVHFDPAIPTVELTTTVVSRRAEELGLNSDSRAFLLIEAPGNWAKNEEGKWVLKPSDQEKINSLRSGLKKALHDKCAYLELITEIYPNGSDAKDHGVLSLHIPPKLKGKAEYKTWFSGGVLDKHQPEE